MNAYDEKYLDDAMKNLGEAFDYAIRACGMTADEFAKLFIASGISDFYGKGNPRYVAGMSGTELVMNILSRSGDNTSFPDPQIEYDFSEEYWAGWILAYYQWAKGYTFRNILSHISMTDIIKLYPTLHEASEEKAASSFDAIIERQKMPSKLQLQRRIYGYSQSRLAEKSGVNLRTLQQYEIGTKDIRKASISTVLALADALGCRPEDIL